MELNNDSTAIAQNDQVFFHTDDLDLPSEGHLRQRQQGKGKVVHTEPPIITVSTWNIYEKYTNTVMHKLEPFSKVPPILNEQDAEPMLLYFERRTFGLLFDEKIPATDPRYTHKFRNEKRSVIEDHILYRQYYIDVGDISHLQVLLTVQLKDTLLNS